MVSDPSFEYNNRGWSPYIILMRSELFTMSLPTTDLGTEPWSVPVIRYTHSHSNHNGGIRGNIDKPVLVWTNLKFKDNDLLSVSVVDNYYICVLRIFNQWINVFHNNDNQITNACIQSSQQGVNIFFCYAFWWFYLWLTVPNWLRIFMRSGVTSDNSLEASQHRYLS